jgi:glycosyltransferase involved in cell wall biosynthesis
MSAVATKRCIIFSYGPVPTPEHNKVEGGGLRCWGLAKGLRAQDPRLEIVVAYHESYRQPDFTESYEDIQLATWNEATISAVISAFDTVIVSYCMGGLSVTIANTIRPDQQLVLDCYVPIYVEIAARDSNDLPNEYAAFEVEVTRWAAVLKRGDIYLCANKNQKRYYQGVLSALGRINPATYQDELILIVPYGVYRQPPVVTDKPITKLLADQKGKQHFRRLLWFGAVYPWFDFQPLVDALKVINQTVPTKLVVVGAKNPFNAHPDFVRRYDEFVAYVASDPENQQNVVLQDWVEFNDRANWYLDSDLVILINKIGSENELAWRTRLVDYIWADLPIITNGGDPLGEELIAAGAAARLEDFSAAGLAQSLTTLLSDDKSLATLKKNLTAVRPNYYWDTVTTGLYAKIIDHQRPTDFREYGILDIEVSSALQRSLVGRVMTKARKLPNYYAKYGARTTYTTLKTIALQRLRPPTATRPPEVIFVSHQLDTTGAPHVFVDAVKDFRTSYPTLPLEFHTFNPADKVNIQELNAMGIKPKLHISRDISLQYAAGDVVVLNTVAFSNILRDGLYSALEQGTVQKLIWYIHEDEPQYIFNASETKRIKRLMRAGKITMFIAAKKTHDNYLEHFGVVDALQLQLYRVAVPAKYKQVRKAQDFNSLRFVLPGMVSDGRKGQLPILYAFIAFKERYFDKLPEKYRDFSLTYVGVGKDFLSRQLLKHTTTGLGERFVHYGPIPHMTCLDVVLEANVTICYSMRECLPMFVYEGMLAGHPLLRNDSSGQEEQLVEGKNGYSLDSMDIEQVIQAIERLCNKRQTTNEQLAAMSKVSNTMALALQDVCYDALTGAIATAFGRTE